jgi:pimeloyl-[acyl-carrier protein] methyl ester esterase
MEGTGQLFAPLLEEIAPTVRVQVVRYPVNFTGGYRQLTHLARQSLPLTGDYVLLGESFSGPIAIALAAELSPRLKGLVLSCSFVSNPQPRLQMVSGLLRFLPMTLAAASPAIHYLLGRCATKALCTSLQAAIRSVAPQTLRARLRAIVSMNVEAELRRIAVPILYLQATDDMLVPKKSGAAIQRIRPGVSIVELEGPHFLLQANPKQAAFHINKFLADVR